LKNPKAFEEARKAAKALPIYAIPKAWRILFIHL